MGAGLESRLVPADQLTRIERQRMFQLLEQYYENVNRDDFLRDLNEKHWVIMLHQRRSGELCGFSTQMLMYVSAQGVRVRGLFSGDTIIAHQHWGDIALARGWGRLALSLIDQGAAEPFYWFLISKGYKTYRFLPLFFHEYYPAYTAPTPQWARGLIDAFARAKYPRAYDPTDGVIRADGRKDRLRPGVAELTEARLHDPHVRYFAERNPRWAWGEELCCLAPLSRGNFTGAAYRVIGREYAAAGERS